MKLYRLPDGTWTGTQESYKALARERGMATTVPEPIEVPANPKEALIDFLNGLNAETRAAEAPCEQPSQEPVQEVHPALNVYDQFDALPQKLQIELGVRAFDNTERYLDKVMNALGQMKGGG